MNIRTTLMLLAATAASLYAQQATGSPAVQSFARLAATAQVPVATVQQRAAALPALSHVPADCEAAFAVCNIGDTISKMAAADLLPLPKDAPATMGLANLDSFAIAASGGTSDLFAQLGLVMNFGSVDAYKVAADAWMDVAQKAFAGVIEQEANKAIDSARKAGIVALANAKVRPIYAVLMVKPGTEAMLKQWHDMALKGLQDKVIHDGEKGVKMVETNGFKGISLRLPEKEAKSRAYATEFENAALAEMSHRTFYMLLKMDGNALVGVICENPADINLPAIPGQSILGTNKLAGCDAHNGQILTTGYVSPKLTNAYAESQLATYKAATQTAINIFNKLAKTGRTNKQIFTAAASGIDTLSQLLLSKFAVHNTQPEFHQIWLEDGSIEAEWKLPAGKDVSYIPGKLRLIDKAKDPSTILYAESTGSACKTTIPWNEIIDAATDISNGFIRTLKNKQQTQANAGMGIAASFIPDAKNAISAIATIFEGLGGNSAFIIDSAGSVPAILGGKPGNTTAIPRMAIYSDVRDRSKIGNGWDQILGIAGDVVTRMGEDPGIVQMLPIVPKATGNTISYSVAMPWFTKDMAPNVTLNDQHFAMGTSPELNAQLVNSATGSAPFTGSVCTIKFKPLADMLGGIASMQREKADAERAAAQEDAYGDDFYYSPANRDAEEAEEIASAAALFASYVDRLHASHTINKDTQTVRISITLKK